MSSVLTTVKLSKEVRDELDDLVAKKSGFLGPTIENILVHVLENLAHEDLDKLVAGQRKAVERDDSGRYKSIRDKKEVRKKGDGGSLYTDRMYNVVLKTKGLNKYYLVKSAESFVVKKIESFRFLDNGMVEFYAKSSNDSKARKNTVKERTFYLSVCDCLGVPFTLDGLVSAARTLKKFDGKGFVTKVGRGYPVSKKRVGKDLYSIFNPILRIDYSQQDFDKWYGYFRKETKLTDSELRDVSKVFENHMKVVGVFIKLNKELLEVRSYTRDKIGK